MLVNNVMVTLHFQSQVSTLNWNCLGVSHHLILQLLIGCQARIIREAPLAGQVLQG